MEAEEIDAEPVGACVGPALDQDAGLAAAQADPVGTYESAVAAKSGLDATGRDLERAVCVSSHQLQRLHVFEL